MSEHSSRVRTLTEKGTELYNNTRSDFISKISSCSDNIDSLCKNIETYAHDLKSLNDLKTDLSHEASAYGMLCSDYINFLSRTNTRESLDEIDRMSLKINDFECDIQTYQANIDTCIENLQAQAKATSVCQENATSKQDVQHEQINDLDSQAKQSSHSSSKSSAIARARAKAEAAKVRARYVEQEAKLLKQKAFIEEMRAVETARSERRKAEICVELDILSSKKEVAAVEAEVEVLNNELDDNTSQKLGSQLGDEPPLSSQDKTASYVQQIKKQIYKSIESQTPNDGCKLNPLAQAYVPRHKSYSPRHTTFTTQTQPTSDRELVDNSRYKDQSLATDFTRFLLKKDLLLNRFSIFNDKAELYPSWKASFKNIVNEIQAEASEEIDLIMKWTGPQSQSQVQSIKAANSNDPNKGLKLIWERLDERFGSPELIDHALKSKLASIPKITIKDYKKLYTLSDILSEILSLKEDGNYSAMFSYFDSSVGVAPIVAKLPFQLQDRWTMTAVNYNKNHGTVFPPFHVFCQFIHEQAKIKNNPSFLYESHTNEPKVDKRFGNQTTHIVRSKKTEVTQSTDDRNTVISEPSEICPIHGTRHALNDCKAFKSKPIFERRKFLKQKRICFRCCSSVKHVLRDCKNFIKCKDCGSTSHPTGMHIKRQVESSSSSQEKHGGEDQAHASNVASSNESQEVTTKRTQVAGKHFAGKSCAKIVLVKLYLENEPHRKLKTYAIIDDQSNCTLAKSEVFEYFGATGTTKYTLSTCTGKSDTYGRQLSNVIVESYDSDTTLHVPKIIECDNIPDIVEEIPTPDVARSYPHLRDIEAFIPSIDNEAGILLLIGRDVTEALHVLDQRIGPQNTPFAQKLALGWTLIGETCLGKVHKPLSVGVKKTYLLKDDRVSHLQPCYSNIKVHENFNSKFSQLDSDTCDSTLFVRTPDDDKPGLSRDDCDFLEIMSTGYDKETSGNWSAPLPFRKDRPKLPNNRIQALKRAKSLDTSLHRDERKRQHFFTFMKAIFDNGHAELAPELQETDERWYLPIFGIYHPKKPDQLRAVFDSSAKFDNLSLNDVLLSGPDLTNSLIGILLRFRRESVAIMTDIQQMFYCFRVDEKHRDYLRFLWYTDNDFDKPLAEYRMCVHVFGNSPSPAIATYGLQLSAKEGEQTYGSDMRQFVEQDFYVDDGLTSLPSVAEAVNLVKRTQAALQAHGNLKLHKISSNNEEVMSAFKPEELAKGLKDLDLASDLLPVQRSLGMSWDLESDCFIFDMDIDTKPYTRRGILSTINSIYDPLGFLSPIVIKGKLLLRSVMFDQIQWDEPLSRECFQEWDDWRKSLSYLSDVQIPRMYVKSSFSECYEKNVYIFSDASEQAIAAVGYLHTKSHDNHEELGFIMGKAKVAPTHGHTIPRLELCAAVLATDIGQVIAKHLNFPMKDIKYHTDSKVVLGYLHNRSRRFYTYVSNRVAKIHQVSDPGQWTYVSTEHNPADIATRSLSADKLQNSMWLSGPQYLSKQQHTEISDEEHFDLQNPDCDKEIRPEVVTVNTLQVQRHSLGSHRFEKFSSWKSLTRAISRLKCFITNCKKTTMSSLCEAEKCIIKVVQAEYFSDEMSSMQFGRPIRKDSPLLKLDPFIDDSGVLRVGGRLRNAAVTIDERNPIIVPGKSWIATLLVRHFHEQIKHQGRHFTAGKIRCAGFWIIGAKRLISSVLHKCFKCRRLRKTTEQQKMADLPTDRLQPGPPFTCVGVDTFGPWSVVTRRTRGGAANSKRWGILFTCMTTRAVHIEVVEDMSSSSFINAFKRFVSIRGPVKQIRSDRGTNFIGAVDDLKINAVNVEDGSVKDYLYDSGIEWLFNSPHSSHMGGSWERLIGTTRRILDSMISEIPGKEITHEVLVTFLAEVSAIINSRPLTVLSSDAEQPFPLTPSLIVNQKPDVLIPKDVSYDCKDLYRAQWKRVQYLSDVFWKRWRMEYLHSLQERRKWTNIQNNIKVGDIVLLKDKQVNRIQWPMGIITKVFPSSDDIVRKVEVRIVKQVQDSESFRSFTFIRPITELVVLL